jgi:hypothetical protein
MAVFGDVDKGFTAQGAVSLYQAITWGTADNTCKAVGATSDNVLGFAQEKCDAGDANKRVLNVRMAGISYAVAGGAITRGDRLKVTATGALIATTTAGDIVCGHAIQSAASGDIFEVFIAHHNKHA